MSAAAPPPTGYGPRLVPPAVRPFDRLAIASFVLGLVAIAPLPLSIIPFVGGLLSLFTVPCAVVGAILGHVALVRLRRSALRGRALAMWGVVLCWIRVGLALVSLALSALAIGVFAVLVEGVAG